MKLADVARVFDGERLTLARHLAGLRKNKLAEMVGRTPTAVAAYENGTKRPSPDAVGQLSLALGVDPDFFSAGGGSRLSGGPPHFRSLRATTQAARDQARAYGLVAADVAETLERHVEFPALNLLDEPVALDEEDAAGTTPEDCARILREQWRLGSGPAPHLVRLLEGNGVVVVFSPPQVASVDAYSFGSFGRPVVVLNPAKRDYYRQRFDVAHELGHLIMHSDAEPGSKIAESQANRFASEFLMPESSIKPLLPVKVSWPRMLSLKEEWKVSLQALLYRSKSLGVLTDSAHRTAMVYISNQGWRRQEPGRTAQVEQPSLLPAASSLLLSSGRTEHDLAAECRVPRNLLRSVIARAPEDDGALSYLEEGGKVYSLVGSVES
ncbi:XRE family transcriptional regulator [Actinomycetospora corticicola]|uniref:Zn-dependent peptidase ImmA (M78 family)/transcriptional regulator with XRE-family HTH domain n=1 Tax=Actinomycetospora corticicola TaxID=663602 RepID=A0A7Y9DR76_9PSEU|nr:ImmA/IrrE family metallo-endopeptidase [Actinomycetospora corticicola]NYD33964.1 Zn-dependent peptidase ImmA (M78 family)/transcriptional regulator with XRE-family HTH domain [Actinomycetospora corticicola]